VLSETSIENQMWVKPHLSNGIDSNESFWTLQQRRLCVMNSDTQENLTTEIEITATSDTVIHFAIGTICESMWICDLEETLDAVRWFRGHDWPCIPTIPLNPHLFYLLNEMQPTAVCIQPVWPKMGVHQIDQTSLSWILQHSQIPIGILDADLSEVDREWLPTHGFTLLDRIV